MKSPIARIVQLGVRYAPKCRCGEQFIYLAVTDAEKGIPFFCRKCDGHARGCQNPNHPYARCETGT